MADENGSKGATGLIVSLIGGNTRFLATAGAAMLLGTLLLFSRDLADVSGFRQHLISGLVVFLLGTVVLGQIETNLNNHAMNQAANGGKGDGIYPRLRGSPVKGGPAEGSPVEGSPRQLRMKGFAWWYQDAVADPLGDIAMRSIPALHFLWFVSLIVYLGFRGCL
jgi:hypothetical protein